MSTPALPDQDRAPLAVGVSGLEADYGGGPVLRGIDLDVAPGEIVALLGPSGCGKTTLLRCVAGLEAPTAGTVEIGGEVVNRGRGVPAERRRVGMVFQDGALFPHLSVLDNVSYGMPRRNRRGDDARSLLRLVGLGDEHDRMPGTLSGGEQQRVALARALARRPGVLLLDEPFSSLDATLRVQLRGEVHRLLRAIGVTTIFVTHDQHEALTFGDRVGVMRAGRLEQLGTPEDLYRSPRSLWVARFVGEANLLEGRACGAGVVTALGTLSTEPTEPSEPTEPTAVAAAPDDAASVVVLCRPEQLELSAGGDARVEQISYFGPESRSEVRLANGERVAVRSYGGPAHQPGDAVTVRYVGGRARTWPRTTEPVGAP